ncbi:MAG TPA: response regulator [Pyrinomonadaceae bacterium]|nr:response regulator [Pyrinomonadaceae bacterium]
MPQHRRRVLCAESNADICHLISTMLRQEGHEVVTAGTVAESLARVRSGRFDLYVLDDYYPDGDGLDLCRELRELTPGTPVLFFTTYEREAVTPPGAAHYLIKPEDIFEVVRTVNSILAPAREAAGHNGGRNA